MVKERANTIYIPEKVVSKKKVGTKVLYEVKWHGYDSSENTFEPKRHLINCLELIADFEKNHQENKKEDKSKLPIKKRAAKK